MTIQLFLSPLSLSLSWAHSTHYNRQMKRNHTKSVRTKCMQNFSIEHLINSIFLQSNNCDIFVHFRSHFFSHFLFIVWFWQMLKHQIFVSLFSICMKQLNHCAGHLRFCHFVNAETAISCEWIRKQHATAGRCINLVNIWQTFSSLILAILIHIVITQTDTFKTY